MEEEIKKEEVIKDEIEKENLFKINLVINDVKYETDLKKDLLVGEDDINKHMDEVSSKLFYWSSLECRAAKSLKEAEHDMKVWMAQKKSESVSKTSETAKEDSVIVKNGIEYAGKIKIVYDREYIHNILHAIVKAFESKKEMLISLGANYRHEMASGLRIQEWNNKATKIVENVQKY